MIAEEATLTHGIAIHKGYIYASSDTTVFHWPLRISNQNNKLEHVPEDLKEIVVWNMNADGQGGAPMGHKTRVIVY